MLIAALAAACCIGLLCERKTRHLYKIHLQVTIIVSVVHATENNSVRFQCFQKGENNAIEIIVFATVCTNFFSTQHILRYI